MIRSLTGKITAAMETAVTIDVRGIGYLVGTPMSSAPLEKNQEITLHTHLAVRETALDLYGFQSITELELFELLLQVPKIGPKSALQVMNQATPSLLIESIGQNDSGRLHKLAGVGKKTSENIVQYLHGKIEKYGFEDVDTSGPLSDEKTDAIDALVSLGYDLGTARTIIGELPTELTTNELVTKALKQM